MKLYTYIFLLLMNAQCTRIGMADSCLASCKRTSNSCFTASILTSNMIYSNQSGASQTAIIKETEPNGNFSDAYKSSNFLGSNSISVKITISGAMSSDSDIDIIEASIGGSAFKDYRFSMTGNAGCELFYSSQSFLYSSTASALDSSWNSAGSMNAPIIFPYKENQSYSIYIICKGTSGSTYSVSKEDFNSGSSANSAFLNNEAYNMCHSSEKRCFAKCDRGNIF
ncbi:MAG TPA: hypothetical protein PKV80_17025 [Leptospiraceae bacterium]|nr:hypothetical protein [Leptospiraceae bacterium]